MVKRERMVVAASQLGVALVLLGAWIYATRTGRVSPILLPKPERVLAELPDLFEDLVFWKAVGLTAVEVLGAFLLAAVVGLALGILLGRHETAARVATPLFAWAQTVPIILFYPICILFFGIGPLSKVFFGGFYGFFPIAANTVLALTTVPSRYLVAAASLGASQRQLVGRVLIPAARPLILSGLRLGAALCLIGVLAGELLGSTAGLGFQIASSSGGFRTPELYAYIIVTLVLVAIFNLAITRAEDSKAPM
jgi:ABC-type nitrate/sulfonate/bicarbonate transport system permease component